MEPPFIWLAVIFPMCPVESKSDLLDGRSGLRIGTKWGYVAALLGGGHICEFSLRSKQHLNPLWRPQWSTMDPDLYTSQDHHQKFGPPPDGRLLCAIAGHSLSFDGFGPPSSEEIQAGLSTHGEAPAVRWSVRRQFDSGFEYGAVLPAAQIDFRRILSVDLERPILYCEETAQNLAPIDRAICWNQHVTIGPPFLSCDRTFVDLPATRSKVIDAGYSDEMGILPDQEFNWPYCAGENDHVHDLRTTPDGRYSRYSAQLIDPKLDLGYIAMSNPFEGMLLIYVFCRKDFPWVGNWEERFHRSMPPWNGRTFCRGLEFSSTPFAIPKREIIDQGRLFGQSTYRWLPAKTTVSVRFCALIVDIPHEFDGVGHIDFREDQMLIHERGGDQILSSSFDGSFFTAEESKLQ